MNAFPALEELLGSYLHMDWSEDHGDVWQALNDFFEQNPNLIGAVATEIDALLATHDEEQLRSWVSSRTTGYYPPGDGLTYTQWLEHVSREAADPNR